VQKKVQLGGVQNHFRKQTALTGTVEIPQPPKKPYFIGFAAKQTQKTVLVKTEKRHNNSNIQNFSEKCKKKMIFLQIYL